MGDGLKGLGEERVTCAHVSVWMIVVRDALCLAKELRFDKCDAG
jgi:hypothetical protein